MIIKEVFKIANSTIYQNYSDKGMYIVNKTNGTKWSVVNSLIDYEYEETGEKIQLQSKDVTDVEEIPNDIDKNN